MKALLGFVAVVALLILAFPPQTASAQCVPDLPTGCGLVGPHSIAAPVAPVVKTPIGVVSDASGLVFGLGASQWLSQFSIPVVERTRVALGAPRHAVNNRRTQTTFPRR